MFGARWLLLRRIEYTLKEADCTFADVVRVRHLLPSLDDFEPCWPLLRGRFGGVRPAAKMMVCGLADPRMRIEIEMYSRSRNLTGYARGWSPHRLSTNTYAGLSTQAVARRTRHRRVDACADCRCSPRCCCSPPAAGWYNPPRARRRTPHGRWPGKRASGSTANVRARQRRSGAPLPASTGWRYCG
ncbi:Rid family hydrolase [Streptomyces vastus]|uniref:Rid family hydrolase n=1 Tax=Streptomyces vastus TaxID=285451 RepID=UPI0031D43F90